MKVSVGRGPHLRSCDESQQPDQFLSIGPKAAIEFQIPDPGELVLQFLKPVFQTEIALSVRPSDRIDIGFREDVDGRLAAGGGAIFVEQPNVGRVRRLCGRCQVVSCFCVALRNEVLFLV